MATKKFASESPYVTYAKKKQCHHSTDFKYKEFLHNCGLVSRGTENVSENLRILNVAIFGIGRAGSIHLVNVMKNPRMRLKYVVDESEKRLQQLKKEWDFDDSILCGVKDIDNILQDKSIHAVIICTPTYTHEGLIKRSLIAKKDVFCEKPIGENEAETSRCYQLAKQEGKQLFCAFNRRYDPLIRELKDKVRLGEVGQVHSIKTVARDCPLPSIEYLKISGGIFHDCLVHDIDLICWILGEYPYEVLATAHAFIPEIKAINDHDTVAAVMKFPSGTIGTIDVSRNAIYGYDQQVEVFGPNGVVRARNEKPYSLVYETKDGALLPPIYHSFPSRYQQAYVEEMNNFCDVLQGLCENPLTGENTLKISQIASCLEKSVQTGQFIKIE